MTKQGTPWWTGSSFDLSTNDSASFFQYEPKTCDSIEPMAMIHLIFFSSRLNTDPPFQNLDRRICDYGVCVTEMKVRVEAMTQELTSLWLTLSQAWMEVSKTWHIGTYAHTHTRVHECWKAHVHKLSQIKHKTAAQPYTYTWDIDTPTVRLWIWTSFTFNVCLVYIQHYSLAHPSIN